MWSLCACSSHSWNIQLSEYSDYLLSSLAEILQRLKWIRLHIQFTVPVEPVCKWLQSWNWPYIWTFWICWQWLYILGRGASSKYLQKHRKVVNNVKPVLRPCGLGAWSIADSYSLKKTHPFWLFWHKELIQFLVNLCNYFHSFKAAAKFSSTDRLCFGVLLHMYTLWVLLLMYTQNMPQQQVNCPQRCLFQITGMCV